MSKRGFLRMLQVLVMGLVYTVKVIAHSLPSRKV